MKDHADSNQIQRLEDTMSDSCIPDFFKRATGREYGNGETCVNDIRRMLMLFWNEKLFSDGLTPPSLIECRDPQE